MDARVSLFSGVVATGLTLFAGCTSPLSGGRPTNPSTDPRLVRDEQGRPVALVLPDPDQSAVERPSAVAPGLPRWSGPVASAFGDLLATPAVVEGGVRPVRFERFAEFDDPFPPVAPRFAEWPAGSGRFEPEPTECASCGSGGDAAEPPIFADVPIGEFAVFEPPCPLADMLDNVLADHANYYSPRNLGMLVMGAGIAAVVANSPLDEVVQLNYQEDYRDLRTDEFSEALHTPKILGNGFVTIPVFGIAALVGGWFDDVPLGHATNEWGRRCVRTALVGAPPMLAMQVITGASRPGETADGSTWRPFFDNNGVSGHSFMGAVPFLCAAKMADDPFWKAALYVGSTLAGLSRVNDDRHYTSQVVLGWWMAYLAATAVDQTERGNLAVFPWPTADGMGVGVEYCW